MEKAESDAVETKQVVEPTPAEAILPTSEAASSSPADASAQKKKCKKHTDNREKKPDSGKSKKKSKKIIEEDSSSSDDSSSGSNESEDEETSSDSDSSDAEAAKLKKKAKKVKAAAKRAKAKQKKLRGSKKKAVADDDSSEEEDSSEDEKAKSKSAKALAKALEKKQLKQLQQLQQGEVDDEVDLLEDDPYAARNRAAARQQLQRMTFGNPGAPRRRIAYQDPSYIVPGRQRNRIADERIGLPVKQKVVPKKHKRASKVAYKRVDQLWDQSIHNFKLTETIDDPDVNEWDQYIFTIRRRFDWEHKYLETLVDVKSKPLTECLQHVMADVKGVSFAGSPHLDPNMLFLYLEEFRTYQKKLKEESESAKKKKLRKAVGYKAQHLKVLIKYLDKDYAETKKTLTGLLEEKKISFDLLWTLYKPNTIAYCSTYSDQDQPRAFKIDFAVKESNFMKGVWYSVEGKYLEYDGKTFGMGTANTEVASFQGVRPIRSLECFPLQYHRDPEGIKAKLIERGKKFVALKGMNYRCHSGMAYTKRKRQVLKININGRVMIDPAIHRRINPNYPISTVKPKEEQDFIDIDGSSDDGCAGCDHSSSSDGELRDRNTPSSSEDGPEEHRKKHRIVKDEDGQYRVVEIDLDEDGEAIFPKEKLGTRKDGVEETFSDEELLIASPVVLGFAFSEKLWLEFTVSGISDIQWNDGAFDSLVLPDNQKSIVKALVSSHTYHPSKSIDDIVSGKGRGLCVVLHGPPGTGKTLTAEGIADLLKCPLYMVSAGDLGTDPRTLEKELQSILDIAHSWGALLLLDEADVFLEKRSIHDIHRNALVSIFLRLLEYFQGILFLTTNRVETFDEAFVSRIHISLRYGELNTKAKKSVWKMFIERVKNCEGMEVETITENDFNDLAKRNLNGRQIKNLTRAAQALAVHEGKALGMEHIKRVIDVAETFEMDLKGGLGYQEAMRGYT